MRRAIGQQAAALKKQEDKYQQQLRKQHQPTDKQAFQGLVENPETALQQVQQDETTYHETLEQISQTIHPFSRHSGQWQTHSELLTQLAPPLQYIWDLAPTSVQDKSLQDRLEGSFIG